MAKTFFDDGLCFSCQRCSSCCRHEPGFVYLSEQDLKKLSVWAHISIEDFIKDYCRWVIQSDGFEYLCLNEKTNYDCIMWDNGCIAYKYRPLQCVSYPFWPSLLINSNWWDANARDCPGVNKGKRFSKKEIEDFLLQRRQEPYIRRELVP